MGRRDIRDVILAMRERGKTIFFNSHLLSELELICDRVAILVAGQVARQGTLDELAVTDNTTPSSWRTPRAPPWWRPCANT